MTPERLPGAPAVMKAWSEAGFFIAQGHGYAASLEMAAIIQAQARAAVAKLPEGKQGKELTGHQIGHVSHAPEHIVQLPPEKPEPQLPSGVNISPQTRIGSEERVRCLDRLAEMYARGFLTAEEHEARVTAAQAAVSGFDLKVLVMDLPAPEPPKPLPRPAPAPAPQKKPQRAWWLVWAFTPGAVLAGVNVMDSDRVPASLTGGVALVYTVMLLVCVITGAVRSKL